MAAGLRCGSTTIKYLLFFFNFLFTLCGLAIVVVGALGATNMIKGGNTLSNSLIFITVVGAFIFLVAFLGCCGAVKESHCMLITFSVLLMTIIVCEVVVAIIIFVSVGSVDKVIEDVFKTAKEGDDPSMQAVDTFQETIKCCGLKGPEFWTVGDPVKSIPKSCCSDQSKCSAPADTWNGGRGCETLISDTLRSYGKIAGGIGIAIAVIEVIGVWFALALAGEIKRLSR